ncbi:hypothetical protein [Vibrio breoganii]|uniref:hypothetical protein n=1 Tax=Vibrio breoganii TaxID=553239 RepID=UPI000C83FFA6|nr:hypothetical protein [Vibrio breoganii]PMO78052.1 hypothetical protein BCT02_07040 [Vibrio breoganii]PMO87914.1 hypothetical protein BCS99_08715 [Vibrio breoganii]
MNEWEYLFFEMTLYSSSEFNYEVKLVSELPSYIYEEANLNCLTDGRGLVPCAVDNAFITYGEDECGPSMTHREPLVEEVLNFLGGKGWELVSLTPLGAPRSCQDDDRESRQVYNCTMKKGLMVQKASVTNHDYLDIPF